MTMFMRLSCALAALLLLGSANAFAQGSDSVPGPVVQCVSQMRSISQEGVEAIRGEVRQSVRAIAALDGNDAPVPAMVHAAREGRRSIARKADRAVSAINETARQCLAWLHSSDAPAALGRIVLHARAQALGAVRTSGRNGLVIITNALESALADEDNEN